MDPSLFICEKNGKLEGILAARVDDLLGAGGQWFNEYLLPELDKEFGLIAGVRWIQAYGQANPKGHDHRRDLRLNAEVC